MLFSFYEQIQDKCHFLVFSLVKTNKALKLNNFKALLLKYT